MVRPYKGKWGRQMRVGLLRLRSGKASDRPLRGVAGGDADIGDVVTFL
jgi:hypothetical protein